MKNTALLFSVRFISATMGFLGALSLMRGIDSRFNWYASQVYGLWFNFGIGLSVLWLAVCIGILCFSVWHTRTPFSVQVIYRKVDYSLILLLFGVGFVAAYHTLLTSMSQTAFILLPIVTYFLAIFALTELIARIRDRNLVQSLYWLAFFKTYPIWRPIGLFAVLLLASQLYLLIVYFLTPIRLFALATICILTYFAAFLLNLSTQFTKANEEKIRAERFKSELITNVSHDIKTPLTSIINYVDLLKNEGLPGSAADYVQTLDRKSERLKTLIDDLMEASKAGTGNMPVNMTEINFGEIAGQVAGEFEDDFLDKDLTLVFRQSNEPVLINADSRHLYRALENLFSNAAKYSFPGTRVFAEVEHNSGKVRFVLQNTSQSLLEISGDELTEQFIRGDKSRKTDGNGLGLYIAKSLIELMGGNLNINISGDLFRAEILL